MSGECSSQSEASRATDARLTSLPLPCGPGFFSLFIFLIQPAPPVGLANSSAGGLDLAPVLAHLAGFIVISSVLKMRKPTGLPGAQPLLFLGLLCILVGPSLLCNASTQSWSGVEKTIHALCSWSDPCRPSMKASLLCRPSDQVLG